MIAGAAAKAAEETDPMEDSYASAEYKRHVATVYARKAIEAAVARAKLKRDRERDSCRITALDSLRNEHEHEHDHFLRG